MHTLAAEAWAARSGVCQDYAHLVVGALRHVGVPARYVSGYLHPAVEPEIGRARSGREPRLGASGGSASGSAHDPTNRADVGERHVHGRHGRDYGDVPPIKGIVAGTPVTTDLAVEVTITQLA